MPVNPVEVSMHKKILSIAVLVSLMLTNACTYTLVNSDGSVTKYTPTQVTVLVQMVNSCAPCLEVWGAGGKLHDCVGYGATHYFPLVSQPFTGERRRMSLTAKGYIPGNGARRYLGIYVEEFDINIHDGSRQEVWEIDRLSHRGCPDER